MPQQPTPDDEKNKMRFAVLDCEDSVKWDGHAIALSRLLGAHGETWEHHRCWSGELPDLREIESYQGLVITGSHYSTRDEQTLPWIGNLKRWIAKVVVVGDVKIYGVCFGAQILAEALGGQVGKNVCAIPFVLQREIVTVTEAMKRRPDYVAAVRLIPPNACGQLSKNKASEQKLAMIQSHGDCVTQLPSSATLLGTSPTAPHEIWALGEDVLAVQGHPELDRDSALTKILPHVRALTEDAAAFAKSSLRLEVDHVTLIGMVRGFLRGCDGLMVGDTAEVVARHVEACRLVLSDTAAPRVHAASQNVSVASSTVDSGAAAAAGAGAASVGSVCGTNGTATSPKSQNNNVSRLAKSSTGEETETDREKYQDPRETNRALRVAAEEAFLAAALAAKADIAVVSHEFSTLARLNELASEKYEELGETVAGLGVFADSLRRKDENVSPLFDDLDAVELNLTVLEGTADTLEQEADRLELRAKEVRALIAAKKK